jgi:hypothetical protein
MQRNGPNFIHGTEYALAFTLQPFLTKDVVFLVPDFDRFQ